MKGKRLVISLVTIVICLCLCMVGIYAFRNASASAVGTVGFNINNLQVNVWGEFQNVVTDSSETNPENVETIYFYSQQTPLLVKEAKSVEFNESNLRDINGDAVDTVYFCDTTTDVPPITFILTIQNTNNYDIYLDLTSATAGENISIERTSIPTVIKKQETLTMVLTLRVIDPEEEVSTDGNFNIELTLNKYTSSVGNIPEATTYALGNYIYVFNEPEVEEEEGVSYSLASETEEKTVSILAYSRYAKNVSTEVPREFNGYKVTKILDNAFYGNQFLQHMTIPNTITSIGNNSISLCKSLKSINFEDGSLLTEIGNGAFQYCENLTTLTIPQNVTTIGEKVFASCSSLLSIFVNELNTNFVSSGGVLYNSDKSVLIAYPAGKLDEIFVVPETVIALVSGAFDNCINLKTVDVSSAGIQLPGDFENCEHEFTTTTYEPTCTEMGYTNYICEKCGYEYKNKFEPAKGHHFYEGVCLVCGFDEQFGESNYVTDWYDQSLTSYIITTKEELFGFSYLVRGGNNFSGKTVLLGNDIDVMNYEWVPIGNTTTPFAGTFDGQNYTIRNITVTNQTAYAGLFGNVTGVLSNFKVGNATITVDGNQSYVGIACAYSTNIITNVSTDGKIIAPNSNYVGGVCGYLYNKNLFAFEDLSNTAEVTGYNYVGGVFGYVKSDKDSSLTNLTNDAVITGNAYVGGLIGYDYNVNVTTGINNGEEVVGTGYDLISEVRWAYIGGCIGYAELITLSDLTNNAQISYIHEGRNVGGVVARNINSTGADNLTNNAQISSNGDYVGGIGQITTISNSYTYSNLTNNGNVTGKNYVGGIAPEFYTNVKINADYNLTLNNLSNSGNITGISYVGGITGNINLDNTDSGNVFNIIATELHNTGNVSNIGNYTGGISGRLYTDGKATISNISSSGTISGYTYVAGLIGYASPSAASTLINSTVSCAIKGNTYVGSATGYNKYLNIDNITNTNTTFASTDDYVSGTNVNAYVGGYVGYGNTIYIKNCTNDAELNYSHEGAYIGGIAGYIDACQGLTNLTNNNAIKSNYNYIGGIVGYVIGSVAYTSENIINTGDISGINYVGGLSGYVNFASNMIVFTKSSNSSNIVGNAYVGGLVGWADQFGIEESSNNGTTITSNGYVVDGSNKYAYVGGYVGYGDLVKIENCINQASINYTSEGWYIGGIAGRITNLTSFTNCQNQMPISGSNYVGGLIGLSAGATAYTADNLGNSAVITGVDYVGGLFGSVTGTKLSLTNSNNSGNVTGNNRIGGLFGFLTGSTVLEYSNNSNTGDITGNSYVGGFVGYLDFDSNKVNFTNCSNASNIVGNTYVGGYMGFTEQTIISNSSNENTTVTANGYVASGANKYTYLGGFIGNASTIKIENLVNNATLINNGEGDYVGGIAGYLNTLNSFTSCENNVNITSNGNYVGGFFGYLINADSFNIENTHNNADISGKNYVGGLMGWAEKTNFTVKQFTNSGNITGNNRVGGLFGHLHGAKVLNYEYLSNTGDITGNNYVGGLFGYIDFDTYKLIISDSTNSSDIVGKTNVGCLMGYIEQTTLKNCSNEGSTLTADGFVVVDNVKYAKVGGIFGEGNDIILENCTNYVAINYAGEGTCVGGIAGKIISLKGMTKLINTQSVYSTNDYVGGLFGKAEANATFTAEEMHFSQNVTGKNYVGGLFGYFSNSSISTLFNTNISSEIVGNSYIGAVAGYNKNLCLDTITNTGTTFETTEDYISGTNVNAYVGGFVGYGSNLTFTNISNEVEINNIYEGAYIGGIAGRVDSCGGFTTVSNSKTIASSFDYVGGISGYIKNSAAITLTEITNTGNVTGKYYVGGIFGYGYNDAEKVMTLSTNSSVVTAEAMVGGFMGYNYAIRLDGCSNQGTTIVATGYYLDGSNKYAYAGGYIGKGDYGIYSNMTNYAEIDYQSEGLYVGGFIGYTTICRGLNNLTNEATISSASNYVGGIAGYLRFTENSKRIEFIYNTKAITGQNDVGGLFGQLYCNYAYAAMDNFHNTGDVNGHIYVGGLVGHNTTTNATFLTNSSNNSDITAYGYVGGFFGYNYTTYLDTCTNEGTTITADGYYLDGSNKHAYIGGYIGYADYPSLKNTTNYVSINYTGEGLYVGGFIGRCNILRDIVNVTNLGDISSPNAYVGGIIGYAAVTEDSRSFTTLNNEGNISGHNYVGGLFGYLTSSKAYKLLDIFTNTGDITGNYWVGGLAGYTYSGWSTLTNSSNSSTITCSALGGSFFGYNYAMRIYDSSNDGSAIIGTGEYLSGSVKYAYIGGYVGEEVHGNHKNLINKATISYSGEGERIGGICGSAKTEVYFENVSNIISLNYPTIKYVGGLAGYYECTSGNVTNCSNSAAITGYDYTGGLFGYYKCTNANAMTDNSNTGDVTGNLYTGGLFGYMRNDKDSSITNSINNSDIVGYAYVGTLFGYNYNYNVYTASNEGSTLKATGYVTTNNINYAYVGGFAGYIYGSSFKDCINKAPITYTSDGAYVGGVAGCSEETYHLTNVSNIVELTTSSNYVGGIFGYMKSGSALTLDTIVNTANITGKNYVGGLFGYAYTNGVSTLTNSSNNSDITAGGYVGGLIGYSHNVCINTCFNDGVTITVNDVFVSGENNYAYLGGYIGYGNNVSIVDCTNDVEIIYTNTGDYVGGFVGKLENCKGLTNLTNPKEISSPNDYVGGICGYLQSGSAITLDSIINTGNITGRYYVGGLFGYGKTTSISTLINSSNNSTITATAYVGAFMGYDYAICFNESTNEGSTVTATGTFLNGTEICLYVGGYVGNGNAVWFKNIENNITITTTEVGNYIGGIAGQITDARGFENVSNSIALTGVNYVGGLVGNLTVTSSNMVFDVISNTANITGTDYVGGLFGRFASTVVVKTLTNLTNTGDVTGNLYVGGIFGYIRSDGEFYISIANNSSDVLGLAYVGAIAGYNYNVDAKECNNDGSTVNATGYYDNGTTKYAYLGGIFGYAEVIILNDTINSVIINYESEGYCVGGVIGKNHNYVGMNNVKNIANVSSTSSYVGGIWGSGGRTDGRTLSNLENTANITGLSKVGGLFGEIWNATSANANYTSTFTNFINSGTVIGTEDLVGGIVGELYLDNSYTYYEDPRYFGLVASDFTNTGDISGRYYVGGLIGRVRIDLNSTLTGGTNKSTVTAKAFVGGLFGYVSNLNFNTCVNDGSNVYATEYYLDGETKYAYLGGFAGYATASTVSDCTNNVTLDYTGEGRYVGGIIGRMNSHYNLTNLINKKDISSNGDQVGGICGNVYQSYSRSILDCTNEGNISGINYVGGLFGNNNSGVSINGNYTTTSKNLINSGNVVGTGNYVGGISGNYYQDNSYTYYEDARHFYISMSDITNTGSVTGNYYVGGLFGRTYADIDSSLTNGICNAIVTGIAYVGGIVGTNYQVNINSCSNEGSTITATGYYLDGTNKMAYLGGYIGYCNAITITDLTNTVDLNYTSEGNYVGGVVGRFYNFTGATNIINNATISSPNAYVGGLFGQGWCGGSYTVSGCINNGNVFGKGRVGGIFGEIRSDISTNSNPVFYFRDNTNNGNITGTGDYVAGLCGIVYKNNSYTYYGDARYFSMSASDLTNTGTIISDGIYVSGILGKYESDLYSTFAHFTNTGDVTGSAFVGGLIGHSYNVDVSNFNNNEGTVTGTGYYLDGTTKMAYVGGLFGYFYHGTITTSTNKAIVNYNHDGLYVGGIAGRNQDCQNMTTVSNEGQITSTGTYTGGIFGYVNFSSGITLTEVTNIAEVSGVDYVGGLFGYLANTTTITFNQLSNSGNVTGTDNVGGLAGYNSNSVINVIEYTNTGDITGTYYVGGLFGYITSSGASTVRDSSSSSAINATAYAGTLAGYITNVNISNFTNTDSSVTANGNFIPTDSIIKYAYVGGIVGFADALAIADSTNSATVTYTGEGQNVGGIAGAITNIEGLSNLTNNGQVITNVNNVGGIVGYGYNKATYTFTTLENTADISGNNNVGGIFGNYSAELSIGSDVTLTLSIISNSGDVTATGDYAGGIAGYLSLNNTNKNYIVQAVDLANTGYITGNNFVAGLIAYAYTDGASVIDSSDVSESITVTGEGELTFATEIASNTNFTVTNTTIVEANSEQETEEGSEQAA